MHDPHAMEHYLMLVVAATCFVGFLSPLLDVKLHLVAALCDVCKLGHVDIAGAGFIGRQRA